ncbi:hypothetical protein DBR40_17550 [Pedobacter sp. KBW01]|uniref:FecR family protein n=1 Tax=Pedobacter sp. KBW01 TaxID=2153364 RepID=UPI000F59931D|nr:FecR domain-containing protein [Pedobacter sp. KBW01]RQO71042.1 hypothetical protein DBR40_17550 [Pedobacter sp. KBW01]
MPVTEELIAKFFMEQCSPAEAQAVAGYLNAHPAVLDKYLNVSEWNAAITHNDKTESFWEEIWQEIKLHTITQRSRRLSVLKYGIAATVVAALVVFAAAYFTRDTLIRQSQQQVVATFVHKTINNSSAKVKVVKMPDGSIIELAAGAKIAYDEPFQHNKRDILLEGEALFRVAKDKTKPFTVYSGQLATTALGTRFKVIAVPNAPETIVELFEGKVVVKQHGKAETNKRSYYLYPGDKLTYNKLKASFDLSRKQAKMAKQQQHLLVFDKVNLSDVFDQLASTYNVHIQYANDDFEKMYYIGSFDQSDSIQHILENIVKVNGLKLIRPNDNEYIITR